MYEAKKVSNLILENFDSKIYNISNLKLNKLLYFCQGWSHCRLNKPIVRNKFEAWKFGPVVRTIYSEFKKYEDRPIVGFAKHINYESGQQEVVPISGLSDKDRAFILSISSYYIEYSASRLVEMTHDPEGPWAKTFYASQNQGSEWAPIPDADIREHFLRIAGDSALH